MEDFDDDDNSSMMAARECECERCESGTARVEERNERTYDDPLTFTDATYHHFPLYALTCAFWC